MTKQIIYCWHDLARYFEIIFVIRYILFTKSVCDMFFPHTHRYQFGFTIQMILIYLTERIFFYLLWFTRSCMLTLEHNTKNYKKVQQQWSRKWLILYKLLLLLVTERRRTHVIRVSKANTYCLVNQCESSSWGK